MTAVAMSEKQPLSQHPVNPNEEWVPAQAASQKAEHHPGPSKEQWATQQPLPPSYPNADGKDHVYAAPVQPEQTQFGAPHEPTLRKVSAWEKMKSGSKTGFDAAWKGVMKLSDPINNFTNKIGSEAFWPSTMDKESDKAARILKSFCKDGFYADQPSAQTEVGKVDGPKSKPKVLVKIPQKVIQNAVGLAIFTTVRTGLWVSGSGGSGVLVSRLPDGSWSPPSGIMVHTLGVGLIVGIDIYDCVLVINSYEALKAFTTFRVTLGAEVSVVAGPVGAGGVIESDIRPNAAVKTSTPQKVPTDPTSTAILQQKEKEKRARKPVFTYMKSRGLYAGLQVDGTFIIERNDENAKFYNEKVRVDSILRGEVRNVPASTRMLMEVLKAADGKDADATVMQQAASVPAPSDMDVASLHEAARVQHGTFFPDEATRTQVEDRERIEEQERREAFEVAQALEQVAALERIEAQQRVAAREQAEDEEQRAAQRLLEAHNKAGPSSDVKAPISPQHPPPIHTDYKPSPPYTDGVVSAPSQDDIYTAGKGSSKARPLSTQSTAPPYSEIDESASPGDYPPDLKITPPTPSTK